MSDDLQERLEAIAEGALLSGALERAAEEQRRALEADPEWSEPRWTHLHCIVEAFAVGVISADPWHKRYRLPPDFEAVVNWIAFNVQRQWPHDEVVPVSLLELEDRFTEWGNEHPSFRAWNESASGALVGVVHRESPVADSRDFIDLHAIVRNAVVHLRNQHRREDAFDREFAQRYGGQG